MTATAEDAHFAGTTKRMTMTRKMKLTGKMAERSKARQSAGVVLPKVKEGMLKDYGTDTSRRWDIIHPSELSHQDRFCPRAVYFRITRGALGPAEKFDFVRENIFDYGNDRHSSWQDRLRTYTQLWGDWKCLICGTWVRDSLEPEPGGCHRIGGDLYGHVWEYKEVTLDAEEDALLAGHADGGLLDKNCLVEIKTIGTGTVRIEAPTLFADADGDLTKLWRGINRPFTTHLNQGDIYLWIAHERGLPFTQISYIYESKWNQQVKEFVIDFSPERSQKLVDQAKMIKDAVQSGTPPECRAHPLDCDLCKPYLVVRERRAVRDRG